VAGVVLLGIMGCSFDGSGVEPVTVGLDAAVTPGRDGGEVIDAAITNADRDGDRVDDGSDNCRDVPNTDQRDHDGDGRGDPCDVCPHIAESTIVDGDGDGVGDRCDPRPTQVGDRIVHFEGFYDDRDGVPDDWVVAVGSPRDWRVRAGRLELTNPDGIRFTYWNGARLTSQVIDTRITVAAIGDADGSLANLGVAAGYLPDGADPGKLWVCGAFQFVNGRAFVRLVELRGNGGNASARDSADLPFDVGMGTSATVRLELRHVGAGSELSEQCALDFAVGGTTAVADTDAVAADGFVGLRTRGGAAAYDYAVIYGGP